MLHTKVYQHRPQTVSKGFVSTNLSQKRFLGAPYPPKKQTALSMVFVGIDTANYANCSATREHNKRAGHENTTGGPTTEFRGAASQCGQGWSARPKDKRRTRGGQDPTTEPGRRVQGRGQSVCPGMVSAARGEGQRRTRPGHRVQGRGQSVCPGMVSAARGEGQRRTRPGHRVQGRGQSVCPGMVSAARGEGQRRTTRPQSPATGPVSVASSFFS